VRSKCATSLAGTFLFSLFFLLEEPLHSLWPSDCPGPAWLFSKETGKKENRKMLWTIFVILLVLWFLGLVTSYTLGGFIHILLVLAVVALVFQLISGRRAI
jgi:hypothetical protein